MFGCVILDRGVPFHGRLYNASFFHVNYRKHFFKLRLEAVLYFIRVYRVKMVCLLHCFMAQDILSV